jgi:hypothetical protein
MHDSYPQAIGYLAPQRVFHKRNGHAFGNPTPLPDGRVAALCGPNQRMSENHKVLRATAEDYPEVHTRRVLLRACEAVERR